MPRSHIYPRWFGSLAPSVHVRLYADTIFAAGSDEALACELGPPQPGPTLGLAWESPIVEYEVWATLGPIVPPEVPQ